MTLQQNIRTNKTTNQQNYLQGVDQSFRILKSMCGLVDLLVSYFTPLMNLYMVAV